MGASAVGRSARSTFYLPGVPYYPALGAGQSLSWGLVTPRCARALASTFLSAAKTLKAAHGEAIVASLVDTLAWVTRGAGAILRGSPCPLLAAAEQFLVDTTPEAIGCQMASRLEGHGQQVAPKRVVPAAAGSSSRAPYTGEPAAAAATYHEGGFSSFAGGYSAAGAAPSRAPRSTWGPGPADRGPAHEYPVDPPGYDHDGGYVREDRPPSPGGE